MPPALSLVNLSRLGSQIMMPQGLCIGSYASNPASGEEIPIWVADYVLGSYGSGAIMAVPAHDSRDHEFAEAYNLPIKQVIASSDGNAELPFTGIFRMTQALLQCMTPCASVAHYPPGVWDPRLDQ